MIFMNMEVALADSDWRKIANQRIADHRQGDFTITLVDSQGKAQPVNGEVKIRQTRHHFHFGMCMGDYFTDDPLDVRYRQFILDHYNTIVAENDMKWGNNQRNPGPPDYVRADRIMQWAQENNLAVRGHCIFWAKEKFVPQWVRELDDNQARRAIDARIESIVPRYRGKLIAWDVNNEMLDGHYFKSRFGDDIYAHMFKRAAELDPATPMFINDYAILDKPDRTRALIDHVQWFREKGAVIGGLGIQEHGCERFAHPLAWRPMTLQTSEAQDAKAKWIIPHVSENERRRHMDESSQTIYHTLDQLSATGLPIHLTEITSRCNDHQLRADGLELVVRTAFSHPQVQAIIFWGFLGARHWFGQEAALVKEDWTLTASGQRMQQMLLQEWRTHAVVTIQNQDQLTFRGFFGTYELIFTTSLGTRSYTVALTPQNTVAQIELD